MSTQDSPSFSDAIKTIKLEDFKDINKIPCSRNALLYGMGNDSLHKISTNDR
ncbi:hypothetical protein BY458DRAFT_496536 [Sporodiniella umbellata]|nr:hypothetical protein BY458DRAFT_496536 [Sporodiniella umbellata]